MDVKYKRVLLKISGEALSANEGYGYDQQTLERVAGQIAKMQDAGAEVAVVVGGGNFWRGRKKLDIERTTSDYMGMLATVMNAMCLADSIRRFGKKVSVQTSLSIEHIAEPFNAITADQKLSKGEIVIFGGGTGCPFFSTDTTASLRAAEIKADMLLLAKNVDGIYDSDPQTNPNAKKFAQISYMDFIDKDLKAMDASAVLMCKENNILIYAFHLNEKDSLTRALSGDFSFGTIIK